MKRKVTSLEEEVLITKEEAVSQAIGTMTDRMIAHSIKMTTTTGEVVTALGDQEVAPTITWVTEDGHTDRTIIIHQITIKIIALIDDFKVEAGLTDDRGHHEVIEANT